MVNRIESVRVSWKRHGAGVLIGRNKNLITDDVEDCFNYLTSPAGSLVIILAQVFKRHTLQLIRFTNFKKFVNDSKSRIHHNENQIKERYASQWILKLQRRRWTDRLQSIEPAAAQICSGAKAPWASRPMKPKKPTKQKIVDLVNNSMLRMW